MYIIIIGAGRVGISLARWLLDRDHEVAMVDRDVSRCAAVEDDLGSVSVVGDGTEAGVLAKAGANRAAIFIAATGADDVNLVACQLAAHRFAVHRTMALVNISEHERLFRILGIGLVVNTTDIIVSQLQEELGGLLVESIGDGT